MGTVKPEKLLRLWAREEIPVEMAIGHLLQNLVLQQSVLDKLSFNQLKSDVDDLRFNAAKQRSKNDFPRKTKKL